MNVMCEGGGGERKGESNEQDEEEGGNIHTHHPLRCSSLSPIPSPLFALSLLSTKHIARSSEGERGGGNMEERQESGGGQVCGRGTGICMVEREGMRGSLAFVD